MRLINAHDLKLEEVRDENVKRYAILSHRWEANEVLFQDMQNPAVASKMKGFVKIQKSCKQAINDGYNYVWADTCCINRESSAELSEAINSMYRWYTASAVCYAFLSDVNAKAPNDDIVEQQIKSSMWFERGWTLQELLAPHNFVFYNQQWEFLGTKQTLSKLLTLRTGVDEAILNREPLSRRSIAQRMSWASQRHTTFEEDIAYCLLGIFDVNMPMLYGEGQKAFLRLQEEIVKKSDDHSIFAWPIHDHGQPGLLADSPAAFANCQYIRTMSSREGRSPYSLTNRGLSIKLMAAHFTTDTYIVRLDCADGLLPVDDGFADEFRLGMFLRRLDEDDQYARVEHEGQTFMQLKASTWDHGPLKLRGPVEQIEINVPQRYTELNTKNYENRINGFRIATHELLEVSGSGKDRFKVSAPSWDRQERIMYMKLEDFPGDFGTVGYLDISQQNRMIKVIKLGFDFEYNPVCFISTTNVPSPLTLTASKLYLVPERDLRPRSWILRRAPFDTRAWSEMYRGTALEELQHPGLWALKGDRLNGLDVSIGRLATLRIVRGEFKDRLVWDVYLDNIKDGITRKIFK